MDTLAISLPRQENLVAMLRKHGKEPSKRLKFALQQIYLDLLFFFQGVSGVFKHKDGSKSSVSNMFMPLTKLASRRMLSIAARLSLTPFEIRFKNLIRRLAEQDKIVHNEIQIIHLEISLEQKTAQEDAQQSERQDLDRLDLPLAMQARKMSEGVKLTHEIRLQGLAQLGKESEKAEERLRYQSAVYIQLHRRLDEVFEKGLY